MTRKLITLVGLLLVLGGWALAGDYTTVTATITDTNSNAYANCTYNVVLYNPGGQQPLFGGFPLTTTSYSGSKCTSSGSLSIVLPSNTSITQASTQWTFNVCAQDGVTCFSSSQTITGTTQDLSAALSGAAPVQPCTIITSTTSPAGLTMVGNCYSGLATGLTGNPSIAVSAVTATSVASSGGVTTGATPPSDPGPGAIALGLDAAGVTPQTGAFIMKAQTGGTGPLCSWNNATAIGCFTQAYVNDVMCSATNGTSPYSVPLSCSLVVCDATAGAVVINLPAATGTGREIQIKKIDSTTSACTPTRAGADTIDGATSYNLTVQYAASKVIDSASGKWYRSHVNQLGGSLSGVSTAAKVTAIDFGSTNIPMNPTTPPTSGQVLEFDGTYISGLTTSTSPRPYFELQPLAGGATAALTAGRCTSLGFYAPPDGVAFSKMNIRITTGDGTNPSSWGIFNAAGTAVCSMAAAQTTTSSTAYDGTCQQGTVTLTGNTFYQFVIASASGTNTFTGSGSARYTPYANVNATGFCTVTSGLVSASGAASPSYPAATTTAYPMVVLHQ